VSTPPISIGIMLLDDVDLLDVGGPYEVFRTASRLVARDGGPPPCAVTTLLADHGRLDVGPP
jgi:hypothetical protein